MPRARAAGDGGVGEAASQVCSQGSCLPGQALYGTAAIVWIGWGQVSEWRAGLLYRVILRICVVMPSVYILNIEHVIIKFYHTFAQWQYRSQWGLFEVRLLLINAQEGIYPSVSTSPSFYVGTTLHSPFHVLMKANYLIFLMLCVLESYLGFQGISWPQNDKSKKIKLRFATCVTSSFQVVS